MKKYIIPLTFRYIESNHDTYQIVTEQELKEYKQFFKEGCDLIDDQDCFNEDGEFDGEPSITLADIRWELDQAIEITPDVQEAMMKLVAILPSRTDALKHIKKTIANYQYKEQT
jgi:hypothetical protein